MGAGLLGLACMQHGPSVSAFAPASLIGIAAVATLCFLYRRKLTEFLCAKLEGVLCAHTQYVTGLCDHSSRRSMYIALSAALCLFAELMIIRVHASSFAVLAHFKNVSMLSCFLGLGCGFLLGRCRLLLAPLAVPLFCLQLLFFKFLSSNLIGILIHSPATEFWNVGVRSDSTLADSLLSLGFLFVVFVFNAFCFIPLGQLTARMMSGDDGLRAYTYNLLGSLAGIAIFVSLSYLWSPPAVWLAVFVIGLIPVFLRQPASLNMLVAAYALSAFVLFFSGKGLFAKYYSPYQSIAVQKRGEHTLVVANNALFQSIEDLTDKSIAAHPEYKSLGEYYGLAYQFKPHPKDVLIVGSGAGNDVAAALRHGSRHVDAVEIDPAIIHLGRVLHPEKPYESPSVSVHTEDARSFIARSAQRYDLIVYGLLDSHEMLSGTTAGVRMDSYVWTVEGFKEAREHLKPDGIMSVSICTDDRLGPKAYQMLCTAFDGKAPIVFRTGFDSGITFIASNDLILSAADAAKNIPFERMDGEYAAVGQAEDLATDDWPFFFLFKRSYPFAYMGVLACLFLMSCGIVRSVTGAGQNCLRSPFFYLGAGFMLVETKAITELSLLYGSTWVVTSIVIASILLLALIANVLVAKFNPPSRLLTYGLLALSLGLGYILGASGVQSQVCRQQLVVTMVLTMPLFFSGIAFSSEIKERNKVEVALSDNLLGAMLGGFLEYNSLCLGLRSLYLIAFFLFLLAYLAARRGVPSLAD
jgi:spermidine synthase